MARFTEHYPQIVTRARARLLGYLLLASLAVGLANFILIWSSLRIFLVATSLLPFVVVLCLAAMRAKIHPEKIGAAFGFYMEALFFEAWLRSGSELAFLWLVFVPFVIVFTSGRKIGGLLLIPPLLLLAAGLFGQALRSRLPPGLAGLVVERPVYDQVSFLVYALVVFGLAAASDHLAVRLYVAYRAERAGLVNEIAKREAKEAELAASFALMEAIFAAIPLPVFIKDAAGRYTRCSGAFYDYVDRPAGEVVGRKVDALFDRDSASQHAEVDARLYDTGRFQCYSARITRRNQEVRDVFLMKTPVRDGGGRIVGIVGVLVDETERIASEKRLMALIESRREALAVLGHDLRNPIGSFRQLVKAIRAEDCRDDDEFRAVLDELGKSLDALWGLTDGLLHWARADEGLADFRPAFFKLSECAKELGELAGSLALEKTINLRLDIEAGLEVWGDRSMVGAILRNLVFNAIKFTAPGGAVAISAERVAAAGGEAPGVRLVVSDNGIGMPEAYLRSLFEVRAAKPRRGTAGEPGTGLGIQLCRRLVERHGGRIHVDSVEGAGTVFSIFLPSPM